MNKFKFGFVALTGLAMASALSGTAWSKSDMSEAEYRAALANCKSEATAKLRDECVSNAKNRYEKGQGAEKKAMDADEDAKSKAAEKMKGGKDTGTDMMKEKGKAKMK